MDDNAIMRAVQQVAAMPGLCNATLIDLLWIERTQILAPEAHARLNMAIQRLRVVTSAPDSLAIEEEALKCR